MSDELKPCPFCGVNNWQYQAYFYFSGTTVYKCGECGTIADWSTINARPIEDALNKRIAELEAQLEEHEVIAANTGILTSQRELEAAQRWIPVSEKLPETYKPVLTVDMSEATQIPVPAFYNPDTKCWSTHFEYDLWVTHWMPLPEPPIVYGKVCEE
jgi:hypothetical protein